MKMQTKPWVKPALLQLDVEKTLVQTTTGSIETLTAGPTFTGRCCS